MGKTLMSLFSEFKKEDLMQLYFHPAIPTVDCCDNYYRITDRDAINSILKRGSCGKTVSADIRRGCEIKTEQESGKIKNKSFFMRRIRDLLWEISAWKSAGLKKWLLEGSPDIAFFASGDAVFSQKIARWVSKFLDIPLVTYVCDEYYFYHKGLLKRVLTKNIAKTIKSSERVIAICEDLGKIYFETFGTEYDAVMTGSSFEAGSLEKKKCEEISYIGNTALNRWKSLIDIADVLDDLNRGNSWNYKLVYYGSKNCELENKIEYGGFLNVEGIAQAMSKSCMLVHVETFDKEYIPRLEYSVSTKIADSLASGSCMLAYGPGKLASMKHLVRNNCCVFAENKADLKRELGKIFLDEQEIAKKEANALETARKFHDSKTNSLKLRKILEELA